MDNNKQIRLNPHPTKKHREMTCIIGGKCEDGVVLISDSKITYDEHPPDFSQKLHREFCPIVTGGAGATDLYDIFRKNVVSVMQSGAVIPTTFPYQSVQSSPAMVQTSGVINLYSTGAPGVYSYNTIQDQFSTLVKRINSCKQTTERNGQLEVLTATQLTDVHESILMYTTKLGNNDVIRYHTIGDGNCYSYVFLKPFYDNTNNVTMEKLTKLGYFIIRYIEEFELSPNIGGKPRFWCVPNYGELFTDKEKSDWVERFENETRVMLENFKQNGINSLLPNKLDY